VKMTGLEKNKAVKILDKMNQAGSPARFGAKAAVTVDRREQRKIDQALGLVPFAVKLNSELVKQVQALAVKRKAPLNEVVAELLSKGLKN
jgi:hypothetical protein